MSIDIRLANSRTSVPELYQTDDPGNIVTPGDIITADTGFMRGHGTYMDEDCLHASVAGSVERVNKLISVRPLKTRYNGEIGDVVIGRIIEVAQRKWRVETHSRMDSILMLSSVNLPGGELRRRSEEDEKMMRNYLKEGDLISAEVQNVMSDGCLSLHTRSLKYGKLGQGTLVKVSPSLILRRKTHFHNLPVGASVILGNNGYIWITPTEHVEAGETGGYQTNLQPVSRSDREAIARLRNCILALADQQMLLFDTSILYTYEVSSKYNVKELLKPEVILEVVDLVQQRLELEGG
ncbi:exosome complex component RRP4-like isoform X1 [Physella acuta]|uniref:exosome complex component RRP4-like isoform X1 n=2 Tax=Physella acuta TaxID=109671 RepID=UPI0027DD29C0|nr:exosome complex component RRP4-like isoform X1 [Physella acuta]